MQARRIVCINHAQHRHEGQVWYKPACSAGGTLSLAKLAFQTYLKHTEEPGSKIAVKQKAHGAGTRTMPRQSL